MRLEYLFLVRAMCVGCLFTRVRSGAVLNWMYAKRHRYKRGKKSLELLVLRLSVCDFPCIRPTVLRTNLKPSRVTNSFPIFGKPDKRFSYGGFRFFNHSLLTRANPAVFLRRGWLQWRGVTHVALDDCRPTFREKNAV